MKKLLLLSLFVCFSVSLLSQNKISGSIVDATDGKAVPFVNVGIFRQTDSVFVSGAASDDKGVFTVLNVPKGLMELRVSAIGYQTYTMQCDVNGNSNIGTLKLVRGTTTLNEVVIADKRPLFAVEGEKTMYNVAEDPSIQTGTASDALQNAPGVEVDVEGNITLRGTSGVEVWINDKPSHMSAENLKTYIQQMPANSIDRVEVITNPSARYGSKADGIINIVTNAKVKKNEFFSIGVNASSRPAVSPWASYVWTNEKLSVNAYLNCSYMKFSGNSMSDKYIYTNSEILSNHQYDTSSFESPSLHTFAYVGINYDIDTANSLSIDLQGAPSFNRSRNYGYSWREDFDALGNSFDPSMLTEYTNISGDHSFNCFFNTDIYFQHKFDNKGHNLSVSLSGYMFGSVDSSYYKKSYSLPYQYDRDFYQRSRSSETSPTLEVVYNRPYSEKGEVSLGITSSYSPDRQFIEVDSLAEGFYVNDAMRSYQFKTYSLENEFFFTLQQKFGNFTVKPGVRFAHEHNVITYPDASEYDSQWSFFSMLPSLHLSYRTKSMHNFKASYTRRVSNPSAENLSSFIVYDEESFGSGNPDLNSVFTDAMEMGWTKYWTEFGSLGFTTYYRGKSNRIDNITESAFDPLYGRIVPFSKPVNVGKSHETGGELTMMYRPNAMFNMRLYANVFDSYLETLYHDEMVVSEMLSYSVRLNLWTKLWNRLEVHTSGYYSSPTMTLFSQRHARYGINCGMRADFFDRKMSVYFNAMDIFNWNSWGSSVNSPYVHSTSTSKFSMRSVSLGVSFRFGKMELESKARQGGSESDVPQQGEM